MRGAEELDSWIGESEVSRAEDLLGGIASLLETSGVAKQQINLVAVSNGPGSYTGIRIGHATALGLKNGLGVACTGVDLFEAMHCTSDVGGRIICAVPFGRADVCWQMFEGKASPAIAPARTAGMDVFLDYICGQKKGTLMLHSFLYKELGQFTDSQLLLVDSGSNLAYAVGIAAQQSKPALEPMPLYLQNSRFTSGPNLPN